MNTTLLAEHRVTLNGSLDAAWQKLVDWKTMPEWDLLLRSVQFDGPLALGSKGTLFLKNGQTFDLHVTKFDAAKADESAERSGARSPAERSGTTRGEATEERRSAYKHYTSEFSTMGSRFIFEHELIPTPGADGAARRDVTTMRFAIRSQGLIALLLRGVLTRQFQTQLPELMERFKAQFESQSNILV